jgi:hypothetical protein
MVFYVSLISLARDVALAIMHSTHFLMDWTNSTIWVYSDIWPNLVELANE